MKNTGDKPRHISRQLREIILQQHLLAELVKTLDFFAALFRKHSLRMFAFGQAADDEAGAQERNQGNPVLRIGNRKRAKWRQKKEVIKQRAQKREVNGIEKLPAGSDDHHKD